MLILYTAGVIKKLVPVFLFACERCCWSYFSHLQQRKPTYATRCAVEGDEGVCVCVGGGQVDPNKFGNTVLLLLLFIFFFLSYVISPLKDKK